MGARGKKRVRANGQVASGKQRPLPRPLEVPSVPADQVREALGELRAALSESGSPEANSPEWLAAYGIAQARLQSRYARMHADAILWRATFLDALVGASVFQDRHKDDGELPTEAMFEAAATIPTFGDETSFDINEFEDYLELLSDAPIRLNL